jgi:hypothetical protein
VILELTASLGFLVFASTTSGACRHCDRVLWVSCCVTGWWIVLGGVGGVCEIEGLIWESSLLCSWAVRRQGVYVLAMYVLVTQSVKLEFTDAD